MTPYKTVPDMIWQTLNNEVQAIKASNEQLSVRTERSETTSGVQASTLALAPLAANGAKAGDLWFVTNGRKTGEGVGAGTGVMAYYDPATDSWFRPADDSAVVI